MSQPIVFNTIEEIQLRKQQLKSDILLESNRISTYWGKLTVPQESSTKGEMIANLVTNSITAIDGFLLVRKLLKTYGWLFKRKKRK